MPNDLQRQIDQLRAELENLSGVYYTNNFSSVQDFFKYSRFNTRLRVPVYSADPTIGEVGDIVSVSGKLKICTVASPTTPTWVIVGTQS